MMVYIAMAWILQDVEITVIDKATGRATPCRIHAKDAAGKPVKAEGMPFWRDHFVCPGKVKLPAGKYAVEVERGPEYASKALDVDAAVTIELERTADLAADGWWSGDLHVHRAPDEIELHMRAEDLHVAPVITWWNNRRAPAIETPLRKFEENRVAFLLAGEDEREGGALLYFVLPRAIDITGSSREYPSPMKFLDEARKNESAKVDIEKPFWWDVPVWLASGRIDTIGIANNHMCRSTMLENEAWGRARDTKRLPPPLGVGHWSQEIYYHALNCGLRLPPSAGSASGVLPNPVGYNRVYVKLEGGLDYEKWWQGLKAGRSFVTNGPMLRVKANGHWPGQVLREGEITVEVLDKAPNLEIVKDGRVMPFAGRVKFESSGWFLVRSIADNKKTFRFASTAPFYVDLGPPRVSRASAKFFADWVEERIARVKLDDPVKKEEVLEHHRRARDYWRKVLERANAE